MFTNLHVFDILFKIWNHQAIDIYLFQTQKVKPKQPQQNLKWTKKSWALNIKFEWAWHQLFLQHNISRSIGKLNQIFDFNSTFEVLVLAKSGVKVLFLQFANRLKEEAVPNSVVFFCFFYFYSNFF